MTGVLANLLTPILLVAAGLISQPVLSTVLVLAAVYSWLSSNTVSHPTPWRGPKRPADPDISRLERDLEARYHALFPEPTGDNGDWRESATRLSKLLKADYLELSALNSRKFFAAHRVLARCREGALGIRLTVHYNLFAGTINGLGSEAQRDWLTERHARGELGCFMLTECSAGVLSGLVVHTTCTWDPEKLKLILHTPDMEQHGKKWISQGLAAKWGICIARLVLGLVDYGPHAFLVDMEAEGVTRSNMGPKTSFNALDNALVCFNQVELEASALLSKFCSVDQAGKYSFTGAKPPNFLVVAQRLLSGRICISDAAVTYFGTVLDEAEKYTLSRSVWVDNSRQMPLRQLPYMSQMFERFRAGHELYTLFIQDLQDQYISACQQGGELPRELVTLIASAKIEAVEFGINSLHLLRRNVGAFGLMKDSPFGSTNEILLCCRFAEGDSRVLQQMVVRDLLKQHRSLLGMGRLLLRMGSDLVLGLVSRETSDYLMRNTRDKLLLRLVWHMMKSGKHPHAQVDQWLSAGDLVYDLAKCHAHQLIFHNVDQICGSQFTNQADMFKRSVLAMQDCEMCHQY